MVKKILIVEDEGDLREIFSARILNQGYDVIEAKNGQEALDKIINDSPDLILMDLMVPLIDGFSLCARVKKEPTLKHIPVFVISARCQPEDVDRAASMGADRYFVKPFDFEELIEAIKNCFEDME